MKLKRQLLVLLALCLATVANAQEVVQGLKLPQLSETDRTQIGAESNTELAKGQLIYNTETQCLEYWNGTKWVSLCKEDATPSCTPIATVDISPNTSQSKTLDCMGSLKLITDASIEFTASAAEATSYEWYVDGAKQAETSATFIYTTPTSTGNHSVYVKAINDCSEESSAPVTVSINQDTPPTVSITSTETSTSVCTGDNLTMTATPEDGTWSSGTPATATIDPSTGVLTPVAAGTTVITYSYTDANSCTRTDTKTITVNGCDAGTFPIPATPAGVPITVKGTLSGGDFVGSATPDATKTLTFMKHNLGADPSLTVKEQMAYSGCPTDMTVFGGWYQWGRGDNAHTFRCDPTPNVAGDPRFTTTQYTSPGQPTGTDPLRPQFIYWPDWKNPSSSTTDKLWGNNLALNAGGNNAAGNKGPTDPCPAGWRVPTQHEWALIGNEGGNILNGTNDNFSTSGVSEFTPNSGIVWVKVNNKVPSTTFTDGNMCGYALYTTDEWNSDKPKTDLTASGAPDPLLFLPAAGSREYKDGLSYDVDTFGIYQNSVISGSTSAYHMTFGDITVDAGQQLGSKGYGNSVRCVASE